MWTGKWETEVSIYNIGSFDGMGNCVVDFWIITGKLVLECHVCVLEL